MRLILVLNFVSLIALTLGYQSGKQYIHKLESYVYTSIKNTNNQFSGTALIGDVIIQVLDDNFLVQINDIRFDVVNEQIEGPFEKHPFTFKETRAFSDQISKPFKAQIKSGQIKQIFIGEDEPDWSINWKKSFLNLLQVSLKNDTSGPTFYTLSEKGSFGECDTTYSIRSEPSLLNAEKVVNITKVRNYEKCLKRTQPFRYAAEVSNQCLEFSSIRKPILQISSVYDYFLRGSLKNYTIEKVVQREFITSAPFGKDGLTFEIRSKRVLELLNINNITESLKITEDVIPSTDLSNSPLQKNGFFDTIDLRRANFLKDILRYEATHNQILTLLDEVVAEYSATDLNATDSLLPSKYGEIVEALSTLDYEAIEQVHKSALDKSEDHRSLLIDSLVASATNPSFLFIKKLIEERKVHGPKARSMLTKLSLNIKESSESLFEEFYHLCTSDSVQDTFELKKTCYLSFSALVGKECVQRFKAIPRHILTQNKTKASETIKNVCNPDVSGKYFKLLSAKDSGDQVQLRNTILLLKTAGNLRAKEAIPFIRSYIRSAHKHYVRATAVWKLVGMARNYPEEVRQICAPLFYNQTEEQDIRIAGLLAWLYSGPSLAQLHLIAKQLMVESNRQLVNMAYTTAKWLTESQHPCHKPFVKDLHSVLWLYKMAFDRHGGRIRRGDSRTYIRSIFDEQFGIGGVRQFSLIASNRSHIPNSIFFSFSDFMATNNFDVFAISIQSYGLEKLFHHLVGKKGVVWDNNSFLDIFKRRLARSADPIQEELENIEKKLKFERREYEPISGDISIYNQGYTIAYYDFDEQMFNSILTEGTIGIPDIQKVLEMSFGDKKQRVFSQSSNRIAILRSEVGIPYFFEYKTLSQSNFIYNKLKLNVEPSLFAEDRNSEPLTEVTLSADLKYVSASHTYSMAGILLPTVTYKVGVGVNRRTVYSIPISFESRYDIKQNKLEIQKTAILEDIFYDKLTPFTYLDSYSNKIPLISETAFKPIYTDSQLRKIDKSYLKDYLGYGLRFEGNILRSDKSDWSRFFSEKTLPEKLAFFRVQPMANPYEIRVRTTAPMDKPSKQLTITIFGDSNTDDMNKVQDFSFTEDSLFKDYTSRNDTKAETYSLNINILGKGSTERRINARVRYSHSRDKLMHKLNINYDRSPLNDNGLKACAVAVVKYPEYDLKRFVKMDTLELEHTINLTTRIAFGQNCDNASKINITGKISQTEEQKLFERNRDNLTLGDRTNPYAINYNYCLNSFKYKYDSFPYCHRYLYPISQMRKLVLDIQYQDISERMANYTQKLVRIMTRKQSQFSELAIRYDTPTPGHIRFESNTSVLTNKVDYRIYAPYYTQTFKDVPLPLNLAPVFTFPLHDLQYIRVLRKVIKKPHCIIQENIVQTFDNITFKNQNLNPKCFNVVSKDCSAEQNFLVMTKIDSKNSHIRAYLGRNTKIDLIKNDQVTKVEVNGKQVGVTQSQPFEHRMKSGNRDIEMFSIVFNGLYYTLEANHLGLSINTDGYGLSVGVERYYSGKVCGICGDNNGDATHEFRSSNGSVFKTSEPFVESYVLKDEECVQTSDANTET